MSRSARRIRVRRPLYARVLRLKNIHPSSATCFLLFEGMIVLATLLSLAELVDWRAVVILPVGVAAMVKLNDIVVGRGAPVRARSSSPLAAGARVLAGGGTVADRSYRPAQVPVDRATGRVWRSSAADVPEHGYRSAPAGYGPVVRPLYPEPRSPYLESQPYPVPPPRHHELPPGYQSPSRYGDGTDQYGWGEPPPGENGRGESSPPSRHAWTGPTHAQSEWVPPSQVQPSQVPPGQVQPGQVSPGQVQPSQIEPGWVEPGRVEPMVSPSAAGLPPAARTTRDKGLRTRDVVGRRSGLNQGRFDCPVW